MLNLKLIGRQFDLGEIARFGLERDQIEATPTPTNWSSVFLDKTDQVFRAVTELHGGSDS